MGYSLFAVLIFIATVSFARSNLELHLKYKWKFCEYEWDSPKQKEDAIKSGIYNLYTCILLDIEKAKDGRVFVTAPKELGPGSPATLATVTDKMGPGGPLLRPYPDWSWHNNSCICDGIANVYRVHIRCNHLFVLDNGKVGLAQVCNPKLLIFNLENDTLVKTIHIPLDLATDQTGLGLLVDPFAYVPKGCTPSFLNEMIIFMADMLGSGLVMYDASMKHLCRIESDYMKPTDTFISIADHNFTYAAGIFSVTTYCDDLYYAPGSAKEIYKIKIKTLLECPSKEKANNKSKLAIKLPSQPGGLATADHAIFYSDSRGMAILGTNVYDKFGKHNVELVQDLEKLQALSGLKYSPFWDQLIFFSDRFQRFALGKVDLNETHFRYFEMNLKEIREKTDLFSPTTVGSFLSIF